MAHTEPDPCTRTSSQVTGRILLLHPTGRLIVTAPPNTNPLGGPEARSLAAARGRYGRNALVQGAAAELFKMWAAIVRARAAPASATIVLCLHDELLVHAPIAHGDTVAALLDQSLQEAVRRWAPDDTVRFVADIAVIARWSDAKTPAVPTDRDPNNP